MLLLNSGICLGHKNMIPLRAKKSNPGLSRVSYTEDNYRCFHSEVNDFGSINFDDIKQCFCCVRFFLWKKKKKKIVGKFVIKIHETWIIGSISNLSEPLLTAIYVYYVKQTCKHDVIYKHKYCRKDFKWTVNQFVVHNKLSAYHVHDFAAFSG